MLKELRTQLANAINESPDTETALDYMAGLYQEAASLIDALREFQAQCKGGIGEVMIETGETDVTTSTARCYVSRPSVRVSYDRKGLDALADNDDELATVLAPYRKETAVDGSLVIRAARQG